MSKICPWKKAKNKKIIRTSPCGSYENCILDKGVNYFVLKLEQLGCKTHYSCEGHFKKKPYIPEFYIAFQSNKTNLKKIQNTLFDPWIIEQYKQNHYVIRIRFVNLSTKHQILSQLAKIWEQKL